MSPFNPKQILAALCCFFAGMQLQGQTHYLHYTTKEGLPSNKVYCAIQDASGFMWFGTDNGLVRYNGSEFKNFTVKDGLPDNDVFSVFEDLDGRLWVLSYKQSPCYFYRNKLYTASNDSFLSKYFKHPDMFQFSVSGSLKRITFYVLYEGELALIEYGKDPKIRFVLTEEYPGPRVKSTILELFNNGRSDFLINMLIYYKIGSQKQPVRNESMLMNLEQAYCQNSNIGFYYHRDLDQVVAFHMNNDSMVMLKTFPTGECLGPFANEKNELIFVRENGEILSLVPDKFDFVKENVPLPEGRVATAAIDNKSNIWLCTHDNGIYVYPKHSSEILSSKKGAVCLEWNHDKNELIAGFDNNKILVFAPQKEKEFTLIDKVMRQVRITCMLYTKGYLLVGTDNKMARFDIKTGEGAFYDPRITGVSRIKDMELCKDGRILIGSSLGAYFFSGDSGRISEKLWTTRTTAVCQVPGKGIFLGTVNGLYFKSLSKDTILPYVSGLPLDKGRITDIKYDGKGRIWVGTSQYGLFIIDDQKILHLDDTRTGGTFITSYYVRNIFIDPSDIAWIGTDKGINRIRYLELSNCQVDKITASFGIPFDNITSLYVKGDTVYIASLEGVARFRYNLAILKETPGLEITGVFNNGKKLSNINGHIFNHDDNNISIEYSGIVFKNVNNLEFNYRLSGSEQWIATASNRVDLPGLKPGKYHFEIKAVNTITGEESHIKSINFQIQPPWYQTYLFIILMVIFLIAMIWLLIRYRINNIRKQSDENTRINKQFAELEMQALRAQMNPHFIFNAMSAIQHYFVNHNEEKANAYMSQFARLIRQMLEYSRDNFISLDEEISLLTNYMSLEKMRFENRLDFVIQIDPEIHTEDYALPSLLVQPILENAVNHGAKPSKGLTTIILKISLEGNYLVCHISDDGIGINQSKKDKIRPTGHQSKGMEIFSRRIERINHLYNNQVEFTVKDISETDLSGTGTIITIRFPLNLVNKNISDHL